MSEFREIIDTTIRSRARELAANITAMNALMRIMPKPKPLSTREKFVRWFRIRGWRIADAYRILRGDDIHEDCR